MKRLLLSAALLSAVAPALAAQGYHLRLDSRVQSVSFRGWQVDSIAAADVVTGPAGGQETPDGYAVSCGVFTYCRFYRPGPLLHAGPFSTSLDARVWGFGVSGLSIHVNGRVVTDLGTSASWPLTEPAVQLLEGYAEYVRGDLTARAGRQIVSDRMGYTGFDGGQLALRAPGLGLEADGYLGWGLAQGIALPVSSPVLNPLDEYQPQLRQLVAGGALAWNARQADLRLDYRRQVDRRSRYLFSEQGAISGALRPLTGWSLSGGAEYDFDYGWWGNADASLRYTHGRITGLAGVKRYRPHFDLWTIWGAFSPTPYHAVNGALWVTAVRGLQLRADGERYWFENTATSTPLVNVEDRGWRFGMGATYALNRAWTVDGGYHAEFGPGAASRSFEGSVTYAPTPQLTLTAHGATLQRPLEFRYDDARVDELGGDASWSPSDALRFEAGAAWFHEHRSRPDAAAVSWDQARLYTGITLMFGTSADRLPLPPARRTPKPGAGR